MPKKKLMLHVWTQFGDHYIQGLAVAIAENKSVARKMVSANLGYEPDNWGNYKSYDLDKDRAVVTPGGSGG